MSDDANKPMLIGLLPETGRVYPTTYQAILSSVIIDTCDFGHTYAKLPDHPKKDGSPRCPHCLAEGLDKTRRKSLDGHPLTDPEVYKNDDEYIGTMGQLRAVMKKLEHFPDEAPIHAQVVGSETGVWNMWPSLCFRESFKPGPILTLEHPELVNLPTSADLFRKE